MVSITFMERFWPHLISSLFIEPLPIFQNSAHQLSELGMAPQRAWDFSHHIHVKPKARPKPFETHREDREDREGRDDVFLVT